MACICCNPCNGCPAIPGTSSTLDLTTTAIYRPSGCSKTSSGEDLPVSITFRFVQNYRQPCFAEGIADVYGFSQRYLVYPGVLGEECRLYCSGDITNMAACGPGSASVLASWAFAGTGLYERTLFVHTYNRRPSGGAIRVRVTDSSTPPSSFSFGWPTIYEAPTFYDYVTTYQVDFSLVLS